MVIVIVFSCVVAYLRTANCSLTCCPSEVSITSRPYRMYPWHEPWARVCFSLAVLNHNVAACLKDVGLATRETRIPRNVLPKESA